MQPLLQWKSNEYYMTWVWVCSPSYPACNAYAPYCPLWPVQLCSIFPPYLTNGTIFFSKKVIEYKMCVLIFSTILSEIFLILRITERDMIKKYIGLDAKYPSFLWDFDETWVFRQFLEKYSNIKFHANPSSDNRVIPCGQTDGRTWS